MIEIRLSFMKYVELDKLKISLKIFFFLMTIYKVFIELVIILLLFYVFLFCFWP